jgi:hypothetical protein
MTWDLVVAGVVLVIGLVYVACLLVMRSNARRDRGW